ncbi:MAG: right-handed parallel beta-helix repeat-containing protein, partial [Candidatus Nanoarchaeia archaeon]
ETQDDETQQTENETTRNETEEQNISITGSAILDRGGEFYEIVVYDEQAVISLKKHDGGRDNMSIEFKDKSGRQVGDVNVQEKNGSYDIDWSWSRSPSLTGRVITGFALSQQLTSEVKMRGVKSRQVSGRIDVLDEMSTEVIAMSPVEMEQAQIKLVKTGDVNEIRKCKDFDLDNFECQSGWQSTSIEFEEDEDYVMFNVTEFSAYAGYNATHNIVHKCGNLTEANVIYTLNQSFTASGTCIRVQANNVTLDMNGYNITGDGDGYGIYLLQKNDVIIRNGSIYNFSRGIYLGQSNDNQITNMVINNNTERGVVLAGPESDDNIIEYSTISYNSLDGIWFQSGSASDGSDSNLIQHNTINNNGDNGIVMDYNADTNQIINNTINSNTDAGVNIKGYSNIIENNTLAFNKYGIQTSQWGDGTHTITQGDSNIMRNNTINSNTDAGIYLTVGNFNIIDDNTINSNARGIFVFDTSSSPNSTTMTDNNIWNCTLTCLELTASDNNTISGGIINNSGSDLIKLSSRDGMGLYYRGCKNNLFKDIYLDNAGDNYIYLDGSNGADAYNNTFLNVSYPVSGEELVGDYSVWEGDKYGPELIREWYIDVLNVSDNLSNLLGNVTIYTGNEQEEYYEIITNGTGYGRIRTRSYILAGTDRTNYTTLVEARKPGFTSQTNNLSYVEDNNETYFSMLVDNAEPVISSLSPSSAYEGSINFYFSVDDDSDTNCSLYISKQIVDTVEANTSTYNSDNSITHSLTTGTYNWYVYCIDVLGNNATSSTISLSVRESDSGSTSGGSSTSINYCDDADLDGSGRVDYKDEQLLLAEYGRDDCSCENEWCNRADINRDGKVNAKDYEILVMETKDQPMVSSSCQLRDLSCPTSDEIGECEPEWDCTEWTDCVNGKQTRTCRDRNYCSNVDKPDEERSCEICEPNWQCNWSACQDGKTYPTCIDVNNCNTTLDKPTAENCSVSGGGGGGEGCQPDVVCSNWTSCQVSYTFESLRDGKLTGQQTRVCRDKQGCVRTKEETRSCSVDIDVQVQEDEWCGEDVIEIYSDKLIARIKDKRDLKGGVDINLIAGNQTYCDYCYNGILDGDEEGIDCGGSCQICRDESYRISWYDRLMEGFVF